MLHLDNKTRKLTSDTGYIKCKEDNSVYNYNIYLGINDAINNYSEATKVEYEAYIEEINKTE